MSTMCWGCTHRALYYRGLVFQKLIGYRQIVEARCPGPCGTFVQDVPQRYMARPVEAEQLNHTLYGPLLQDSVSTTGLGGPRDSLRGKIVIQ